jgi:hypothetical protein
MPRIKGIKKDKVGNYTNIEKKRLLLISLNEFFGNHITALKNIHQIIDGKSTSLRLIEYFITNYSKVNNTYYKIKGDYDTELTFFVNSEYKNQLKSFTKKHFDPFKREERIEFKYLNDKEEIQVINTTIGQLNFFRWVIKSDILKYINKHHSEIEESMNKYTSDKKLEKEKKKQEKLKKKNKSSLLNTLSQVSKENIATVSFD